VVRHQLPLPVPEFTKDQTFRLTSRKILDEFQEAQALGINGKPVLLGPVSYLLLGKEKEPGFKRLRPPRPASTGLPANPGRASGLGAEYVQIDEPYSRWICRVSRKRAMNRPTLPSPGLPRTQDHPGDLF